MNKLDLSIIIPAHNEELLISEMIAKSVDFLRKYKINGEVIVVENGSKDQTLKILQKNQEKYHELKIESLKNPDKGLALKKGMQMSKGNSLVTIDADLWDEKFVLDSLGNLKTYDIVVGSRAVGSGEDRRPLSSRLLNIGYNFLFKLVFNLQGTNTHAQLSFRREKILPLVAKCRTSALNFDTELILRAERAGLTKIEVPVVVEDIRGRRYELLDQLFKTVKNFLLLIRVLGPTPDWSLVFLGFALILGAFFRFYNYYQWFFFSVDEELYSFMTRMITVNGHLPAIGGPISGSSLYSAPWFLYFNSLWFLFSGGNVIFSGMVFAAMELIVIVLIYFIGKRLFSPLAGSLAALTYSASFLMAIFDRHYWNITLVPLISTLTLYSLLNVFAGRKKWLWIASLTVGFGLSTTFSVVVIFLLALLTLTLFSRSDLKKNLTIFLSVIFLFHIPLIIFDLRHNFWLVKGIVRMFSQSPKEAVALVDRIFQTGALALQTFAKALVIPIPLDFSNESSICLSPISHIQPEAILIPVVLAILIYGLVKTVKQFNSHRPLALIWILLSINFLSLILFHSDQGERHFLPSLPIIFVLLGALLADLYRQKFLRVVTIITVIVLIAINLTSLLKSHASYGIQDKINAVNFVVVNTKENKFNLDSVGGCHKWGYRYLFSMLRSEPSASYMDSDFSWMYKNPPQPQQAQIKATLFSPDKNLPQPDWLWNKRKSLQKNSYLKSKFGNIEVYLEKI